MNVSIFIVLSCIVFLGGETDKAVIVDKDSHR